MPIYTFDCGKHIEDRIVDVGTRQVVCHCAETAFRVFDFTAAQVQAKYASEFELTRQMRDLRDEATHWKEIALRDKHEAEMNGFTATRER